MNRTLKQRIEAVEKWVGHVDKTVGFPLGDGRVAQVTAAQLDRAIQQAQGTAFKPVELPTG